MREKGKRSEQSTALCWDTHTHPLILTFRLRAFVYLLLLFLTLLSLAFVLLLDFLPHARKDGLEHDGILVDLQDSHDSLPPTGLNGGIKEAESAVEGSYQRALQVEGLGVLTQQHYVLLQIVQVAVFVAADPLLKAGKM